jgi:membrane protease YdiL (CAAX protease family)
MNYQVINIDMYFHDEDLRVFIPIVGTLIGFIIFWFTWQSTQLKERLFRRHGADLGSAKLVIYTKVIGGLSMGLLPAITYWIAFPKTQLVEFGWHLSRETIFATMLWTAGLSIILVLITGMNARKPENLQYYPQIRAEKWTRSMVRWNLIGWAVYLIGYEALFRGVLLFPLMAQWGLWPTVAVNIALYSGTHIPKGLKETIGAIPLCVVLCLLCAQTGNFWLAAFVHVAMAWTNEIVSLRAHPNMKIIETNGYTAI